MEQSVHRPLSQSGLPIVRRVNSAIRERVGLDLLAQTTPPRGHLSFVICHIIFRT